MEQIKQLKKLLEFRPSAIRNTVFVFTIRFVFLFLSLGLVGFGIFVLSEYSDDFLRHSKFSIFLHEKWILSTFCLAGAILCYLIRFLGRQLLVRNDFILTIQEFADSFSDEEPVKAAKSN